MSAIISRERYAREIMEIARKAQARAGLPADDRTALLLALGALREPESAVGLGRIANALLIAKQKKNPAG